MKRIILLAVLVFMLIPFNVFAGDLDEGIKRGQQDAFIIGKVTGMKDNLYSVHIEKVLMGDVDGTDVQIEKSIYSYNRVELTNGKYYALSIDRKDTVYEIKFGAYTVDSTDYQTLKIDNATNNSGDMLTRIQEFINSGEFIAADRNAKEKRASEQAEELKRQNTNKNNLVGSTKSNNDNAGESFINVYTISASLIVIIGVVIFAVFYNKRYK